MTSHITQKPEISPAKDRRIEDCPETGSRETRLLESGRSLKVALALVALVMAGVYGLQAQSPVGQPEITPKFVELNQATQVKVTSRIDDPGLIGSSVMLQRYDNDNSMWVDVGMMHDDGAGGDLKKADKIFTWQGNLTVTDKANPLSLRIVAKLNGMKNVESGKQPLTGVKQLLKEFAPDKIQTFLDNNSDVRSAAVFLQRLNPAAGFKHDWIMITNTLSAQQADAEHPRIILQDSGTDNAGSGSNAVFGVATTGDKRDLIEYIQWDSANKRFRFHEIDTRNGKVSQNVADCNSCHGPQLPKQDWPYPRPNWDAYDNWGGALPFNRDRVYIGKTANAIEGRAVQRLLKDLANDPVVGQLDLPEGISRADDGSVIIVPDPVMDGSPAKLGKDEKTAALTVRYQKEEDDGGKLTGILFPGDGSSKTDVAQGGQYLVMHHLGKGLTSDEGRGVALFDNFSALNAQRVAQELNDKFDKEGVQYVDIRPVALAIAGGGTDGPCNVAGNLDGWGGNAMNALRNYFKITKLQDLIDNTHQQRRSLPQIKAEQEAAALIDLLSKNGDMVTDDAVLHQIAQRSIYGPPSPANFKVDELTKFMIDREIYGNIDRRLSLFRLFLEPSHEPVNKWSLSLSSINSSTDRSATYTFGDVFETADFKNYIVNIRETLNKATFGMPDGSDKKQGKNKSCAELQKDSKAWFDLAIKDHPDYFKHP